ncbi:OSCP, subunit 5 of the stator stalk of mitochondrial F1F0 ATP synthase [Lactarius hengduanensis]|nr:OSCP, subunit 5 of the stator stalk of mitochondrial F1F0 ATP synthase [Lactarius hengduanensis]
MSFSLLRTCAPTTGFGRRAASGIALKYATATFSAALAKSPQVLTKVQTELNAISKTAGLSGLYARAEGTGAKKEPVSDITRNLFIILSENGRLGETTGVIEGFNELVAKHKGELNVTVTSAVPLTKDVLTRLEATLKQSQTAQQAKSLKLTNKVNPSVLGGLVVDFGEKTIDLSVSSRINKLNSLLQQSV